MTLREEDALLIVRETFVRTYKSWHEGAGPELTQEQLETLVMHNAVELAQEQQRTRETLTFEELDAIVRGDPTQSGVLDHLTDGEKNRLLWELKQGCLTAVVNCLPAGERAAFVLSEVLGEPPGRAANLLGINASALRVRVSRARKKVGAYLAPRCQHVDSRNPCRCPSRLGVALNRGFIGDVRGRQISLRSRPFDQEQPQHDPVAIFRALPVPEPPEGLEAELQRDLAAGIWD